MKHADLEWERIVFIRNPMWRQLSNNLAQPERNSHISNSMPQETERWGQHFRDPHAKLMPLRSYPPSPVRGGLRVMEGGQHKLLDHQPPAATPPSQWEPEAQKNLRTMATHQTAHSRAARQLCLLRWKTGDLGHPAWWRKTQRGWEVQFPSGCGPGSKPMFFTAAMAAHASCSPTLDRCILGNKKKKEQ